MNSPTTQPSKFLSLKTHSDVAIAEIQMTLMTEEQNIEQMMREVQLFVESHGLNKLIVMMDHVEFLTSYVMGKLIMLNRTLHRAGGTFVMSGITPRVQEVLLTSSLTDYFNITDNVEEGLKLLATK